MIAALDFLAVLLLGLFAVPLPPAAVVPALWVAVCTPSLVRADVRERRLPNGLTLPGLAVAVGCCVVAALGPSSGAQDARAGLAATATVGLVGAFAARAGALGLGDVKLAALLAGSLGLVDPGLLVPFAAATGLVGGAVAMLAVARPGCAPIAAGTAPSAARGCASPSRAVAAVSARRGGARRPQQSETREHRRWRGVTVPFGPVLLVGYWAALALRWIAAGGIGAGGVL